MAFTTYQSNQQFMALVDNPERLTHRAVMSPPSNVEKDRPTGRGRATLDRGELMSRLYEESYDRRYIDRDGLTVENVVLEPALWSPVNPLEVGKKLEDAHHQVTDKLNVFAAQVTEESPFKKLKNLVTATICRSSGALVNQPPQRCWLPGWRTNGLGKPLRLRLSTWRQVPCQFKWASRRWYRRKKIVAPIVQVVESQVRNKVNKSAKKSIIFFLLLPPLFPYDSSSSGEEWKPSRAKKSLREKKKNSSYKSDHKGTCSRWQPI